MALKSALKVGADAIWALPTTGRYRKLAQAHPLPNGWRRIYHYHIRKTGGTSVDWAFYGVGGEESGAVRLRINQDRLRRTISNGLCFVSHNRYLIGQGDYFYAASHLPYHELSLPPQTFTFTILRDPVARLISHYQMLMHTQTSRPNYHLYDTECRWLGANFREFLERIPQVHLLHQLYLFSADYDVAEAAGRIAACNCCLFLDQIESGVERLRSELQLPLVLHHARKSKHRVEVSPEDRQYLRTLLEPEYDLLERARAIRPH